MGHAAIIENTRAIRSAVQQISYRLFRLAANEVEDLLQEVGLVSRGCQVQQGQLAT